MNQVLAAPTERDIWLAKRRAGIGGSDIAAILGLSPWGNPLSVWLDKKGLSEPKPETPEMKMGHRLEPVIADMYSEVTGNTLITAGLTVHPNFAFILGTPDRLVANGGSMGLEIKTANPFHVSKEWGEPGTDEIPQYYLLQCIWYQAITNRDVWDVAVLIGGSDFRIYKIHRDKDLENALIERAAEWWTRYIVGNEEPPIDGSKAAAEYITSRYPRNVEPLKLAPADVGDILASLATARKEADAAEEKKTLLENQIKLFIGDAAGVESDAFRATWKSSKDSAKTDWESLAEDLMSGFDEADKKRYLAEHTIMKPGSRRFLFTEKGDGK